jgi:colanic acid biosynthesis glycosyl transferase WcaI
MRVVVWGINYAPEQTGIGPYNLSMCEFLAERGHTVHMVTGFEYYPVWKKRAEDAGRMFRDEDRGGVKVHRCWLYVPHKLRAWKRIVHELSFVITSFCRVLILRRPDVFVIVSPPLLLGVAGAVAGFLKRRPFIFHVQDLQPDAAIRLGMLRVDRSLTRVLYGIEFIAYAAAARIASISPGILRMIREKGVTERKLIYFPNGVRCPGRLPRAGLFRQRHHIPPAAFIVLYSGNLGAKQGLGVLIEAARFMHKRAAAEPQILFVIAGAGAMREELATEVEKENLSNILLLPLQPEQAYHEMLVDADCCAITQQAGTGELFFPSKLLTALAFGKPVLSIADEKSDLALAVAEGGFGVNVQPGSSNSVVAALDRWAFKGANLERQSQRAREYGARFEIREVLETFEKDIEGVASGLPPATSDPSRSTTVGVSSRGEE